MVVPGHAVRQPLFPVCCCDGIEGQLSFHIVRLLRFSLADEHSDLEYVLCMHPVSDVPDDSSEVDFPPDFTESAVRGNRNLFHVL